MSHFHPTPYPKVNFVLGELLPQVQAVLGNRFVGMYLDGSMALGDFDEASDIDFVVVAQEAVTEEIFLALQKMHDQIATLDSLYATQLEGSYISRRAIKRHDDSQAIHPNIERGQGERLKMALHDKTWIIHRTVLREKEIVLTGPEPSTLINAVSSDDLREAMQHTLAGEWTSRLLAHPDVISNRGYQSYIVLTLCRILYTLELGTVASKPVAARWAQETLDGAWHPLIERALVGRHQPDSEASLEDVSATLDLIRTSIEYGQRLKR